MLSARSSSGTDVRSAGEWLMWGVPSTIHAGGSLRAAHLLRVLVERTGAATFETWGRRGIPLMVLETARRSALWRRPLQVASTQLLPAASISLLRGAVRGRLLDLHDHPRLQLEAFGIPVSASTRRRLDALVTRNADRFERLAVPSASFGQLCALPEDRVIVASNGTDPTSIVPEPGPNEPVVAMVSGAAPGRGIELLISAAESARAEIPEIRLRLALQATGPASREYLSNLRDVVAHTHWITIDSVPYEGLSAFLAGASVLAVPHPPSVYLDVATPVKLFDGMAAGRPSVVTPRVETARIVERRQAGLVAGGETPDDIAAAILRLLSDSELRMRQGANARQAAVDEFDWRIISRDLAAAVLGPELALTAAAP